MDKLFVIITFVVDCGWCRFVCHKFRSPSERNTHNRARYPMSLPEHHVFTAIVLQLLLAVHPVVFLCMLQAYMLLHKLHVLRRTQHRFTLVAIYMCATWLTPFWGHHPACQCKSHLQEDTSYQSLDDFWWFWSTGRHILCSFRWNLMILI